MDATAVVSADRERAGEKVGEGQRRESEGARGGKEGGIQRRFDT